MLHYFGKHKTADRIGRALGLLLEQRLARPEKSQEKGTGRPVERWFAAKSALPAKPVPPMFTPFKLRGVTLANRVVVSPMAQYSCRDGTADDYYLVHLGSRAHGGGTVSADRRRRAAEYGVVRSASAAIHEVKGSGVRRPGRTRF